MALPPKKKVQSSNGLVAGNDVASDGGLVAVNQIKSIGYVPPEAPSGKRDALGAGLEAAGTGLAQGLPYATLKALGIATPEDDAYYQQKFQTSAAKQERHLPGGPKSVFSSDPLGGVVETLAYGAPQMASEMGAGALGALGGGVIGGPVGALAGGAAATAATAFPQYVGSNAVAATEGGQTALSDDQARKSFIAAGGQSVLDAGLSAVGLKALSGKGVLSHGFTGNLLQRAAKGAVEGAPLGSVDQVARGIGTQYAAGKDLTSDQSLQEDIEGAGVGGLFGAAGGVIGGALGKAKAKARAAGPEAVTSDTNSPILLLSGPTYSPEELHPGYAQRPVDNNGLALPAPPEPPPIYAQNPTKRLPGPPPEPDQPITDPHQNNPSAPPPRAPDLLHIGTDRSADFYAGRGEAPTTDRPAPGPEAPKLIGTDRADFYGSEQGQPQAERPGEQPQPGEVVRSTYNQSTIAASIRDPNGPFDPHTRAVTSALTKALGEDNPEGALAYLARKTKELEKLHDIEDPAILGPKQAVLDRAAQLVARYKEDMAKANAPAPNATPDPAAAHVASALANTPDHPATQSAPPTMVDAATQAKLIRDAEKEALAAHQHETKLQAALEDARKTAQTKADETTRAEAEAHAKAAEQVTRKALLDKILENPAVRDPAAMFTAWLKRHSYTDLNISPEERALIHEHEEKTGRLGSDMEPATNPKEDEITAVDQPMSPDRADRAFTAPEPKPPTEPEPPAVSAETVRDRATEAFQNGHISDKERRMVEAAIERGTHTPEEINGHIDRMIEAKGAEPRRVTSEAENAKDLERATNPARESAAADFAEKITSDLRKRLDRFGLHDVGLRVQTALQAIAAKGHASPTYSALENLVKLVTHPDSKLALGDPFGSLDHEAFHAMEAMGLITADELKIIDRAMSRQIKDWAKASYTDVSQAGVKSEARAEMFAQYGKQKTPVGLQGLARKIARVMEAFRNWVQGQGWRTADDVFKSIHEGELGTRIKGESTLYGGEISEGNHGAEPKMFVGKDAEGVEKGPLAEAKIREAAGQDAGWHSKIHEETGWHKTPGGDWVYEISDHNADFHTQFDKMPLGESKLSDVFAAPEAFKAYPDLRDIRIEKKVLPPGVLGRFDDVNNVIEVSHTATNAEAKNTVLHEMQHAVQAKEGMARGGNTASQYPTTATLTKLKAYYTHALEQVKPTINAFEKATGTKDLSFDVLKNMYAKEGKDPKTARALATRARDLVIEMRRTEDQLRYMKQFDKDATHVDEALNFTKDFDKQKAARDAEIDKLRDKRVALREEIKGLDTSTPEGKERYARLWEEANKVHDEQNRLIDKGMDLAMKYIDHQRLLKKAQDEFQHSGGARDAYKNLAGEVQARATGDSADLTPEQRAARNPYDDQGVQPEHQLITRDKVINYSEEEEPHENLVKAFDRPTDANPGPLPKNPMARGASDMALDINDNTRRKMLILRTLNQLADRYKHLPQIAHIKDVLDVMARARDDLIRDGGIIHHAGRALPKEEQDALSLVFDAEQHQVDVLSATARSNPDNSTVAKEIHDRFAKLSPEAKDVYKQMIAAGKAKAETVKKIFAETIRAIPGLEAKVKERLISQMEAKFAKPVYFPHVWDGDFITIGKSEEFKAAEASRNQDALEKLRTDGNHYIVRASRNASDQRALVEAMRAEGMDVSIKKREAFHASTDIVPDKFMRIVNEGIEDHIRANPDMEEGLRGMKDMLNETRYSMMPDGSQLANKFRRRGVQGFERDALGVFARATKRDADYLTKLKYNTEIRQKLDELSTRARANNSNADMDVSEQMRKHFNTLGKYSTSPVGKILNNLTYAYYLGMSPSFMVMHLMQTPMITTPWLAARFDPAQVVAELGKAGAEGTAGYRRLMLNEGTEHVFGKTADEKEALKFAATRGLFQATQAHSLMIDAAGGGIADHIAASAMHVASFLPHHTERYNRLVTYLAAYRLAMKNPEVVKAIPAAEHSEFVARSPGKFELNPQQLAAARFAQEAVNTTHVDYSGHNAAHIMQPGVVPFGEVMFQFQKYQQGMISILADSLSDTLNKNKSPEARWAAGKTLAGILATHATITGLMGLPLVGTAVMLSNIQHKLFGNKNKPFDGDDAIHRKMVETFGPTWGEVALRGVLYTPGIKKVLPADITDRIGLGDILTPSRQFGDVSHEQWLQYIGSIAGGPSASLLGQFADAYKYHEHGQDWKASEQLMPKVMRDISKTIRFYNEGVTSGSGDVIVPAEEMRGTTALTSLIGFQTQEASDAYANRRAVQNASTELSARRKDLLARATNARISGDTNGLEKAKADIAEYNAERVRDNTRSMRITGSEVMRSFATRRKNNQQVDHGVSLRPKRRDLAKYAVNMGDDSESSGDGTEE